MGRKDTVWHEFLKNNVRYADMINAFGLEGKQIVSENDIKEADGKAGTGLRDEVRKVVFGINFAIIGIENQSEIDYSMVARVMRYESTRYDDERKSKSKSYNRKEHKKELKGGEYMYLFKKTDTLHPVITFVVYCGKEPWDAAKSIKELVDTTDIPDKLLEYMSDYRINVIDVRHDTGALARLNTDVRDVLEIISCSEDKEKLEELLSGRYRPIKLNSEAYNLAKEYANLSDINIEPDEKGDYDMCKAIEEIKADSRNKGIVEGKIEGKILAYFDTGMKEPEIATKTGQTVDFVKDTLKANGLGNA